METEILNTARLLPGSLFLGWGKVVKRLWHFRLLLITMWAHLLHSACREGVVGCVARGIASFSTRGRLGWQSFPNILKIVRMTSMHWRHQHFELLAVEWLNQKLVGPGLQDYMCWLRPCWLWIDGGTNLQLHENAVNAEMDQEKKPKGRTMGKHLLIACLTC